MAHLFMPQQQNEVVPSYPQSPTRYAVREDSFKGDVTPPRRNTSKFLLHPGSFHGSGGIITDTATAPLFDLSWTSYSSERSLRPRSSENSFTSQQQQQQQQQRPQEREVSARSANAEKLESDLKSWKQRLMSLEQRYDEIGRNGKPSWEDMKKLLKELKRIMRNEQLKDVVEFQNGIARIKSKVLMIQQKWASSKAIVPYDSNNINNNNKGQD